MKKKKFFIVLKHIYTPSKTNPGRHEALEKCEFVTRVTNQHLSSATVIIDVVNDKFVKNRVENSTLDQFMSHIKKQHPHEWEKFNELMIKVGVFPAPAERKFIKADQEGNITVNT
jgi:hypothetical protein